MTSINTVAHLLDNIYGIKSARTPYSVSEDILNRIKFDWSDKKSKLLDPDCGHGIFLLAALKKMIDHGDTVENAVKNRIYGCVNDSARLLIVKAALKKITNIEPNIYEEEYLFSRRIKKMKFDVIVGNPPYQGKAQLHQQFFNLSVDLLKDNGYIGFIQPATPYFNKKDGKKHEKEMQDNLLKYDTSVKFVSSDIFKNAGIANDLAITIMRKKENNKGLISYVEYKNGKHYTDVNIEDINYLSIDGNLYRAIRDKYQNYINKNGSMRERVYSKYNKPIDRISKLQRIRGHMYCNDFYTFVSNDKSYYSKDMNDTSDHGIKINSLNEMENVYIYLKTFVARFGLAFRKINTNNQPSEFELVPLVDLKKSWDDEKLSILLGLTKEEMDFIKKTLPDYHGLLA